MKNSKSDLYLSLLLCDFWLERAAVEFEFLVVVEQDFADARRELQVRHIIVALNLVLLMLKM